MFDAPQKHFGMRESTTRNIMAAIYEYGVLGSNVQSDLIANNRLNYAQSIHGSKTRCHSFVNTARAKLEQIRFAGTNFLGAIFLLADAN